MSDVLTDLQRTLLANAAARPKGAIFPLPDTIANRADRIRRSVQGLITKGLAAEAPVDHEEQSWRMDGNCFIGVVITRTGMESIEPEEPGRAHKGVVPAPTKRDSKTSLLIAMLSRPEGVSVDEVMEATGWLPHTARAAITILKTKNGHNVERTGERGASRYRIVVAA